MNLEITWNGTGSGMDREVLNKPHPEVWCERCHCVHAARPAGSFDAMISHQAQEMAARIDADLLAKVKK